MVKQAFSYIRFSTKKQQHGDSLRRQVERARAFCARMQWTLNEASYQDLGVSARKGKNALLGNLGEFLRAIEKGSVKPGEALIVESLDRITRAGVDSGFQLIRSILISNVDVVTLTPERHFTRDSLEKIETRIEIELILKRAAEESEMKEMRALEVAKTKRKRAAETGEALSGRTPGWIRIGEDGKPQLIKGRAEVIQKILQWAAAGYGFTSIVRRLKAENIPPFKKAPWNRQYLAQLLKDERVIGKLQPLRKNKTNRPDPLPTYYPPAATEAEWFAARARIAQRKRADGGPKGGRVDEFVNLFTGLLWDVRTGEPLYMQHRPGRNLSVARLVMPKSAAEGRGTCISFPLWTLERAILSQLAEVRPEELTEEKDKPDEVSILSGQIAEKETLIAEVMKELKPGKAGVVVKQVQQWEEELEGLKQQLTEAQQRAAHPLSEAVKEMQGLLAILDTAEDQEDCRIRLRGILKRVVESIRVYVADSKGVDRFCSVLIQFKGSANIRNTVPNHWYEHDLTGPISNPVELEPKRAVSRVIFIQHQPPKSNGKAGSNETGLILYGSLI